MIIYHGSDLVVKKPGILKSNRLLDFGSGFYTTTNKNQAIRWAKKVKERNKTENSYVTVYEFKKQKAEEKLNIIYFKEAGRKWLNFILKNRNGNNIEEKYDIAIGPVADDNVYLTVKLFETGVLDEEEALKRLKVRKLFNQILFHSEKSLDFCTYKDNFVVSR